MRKGKHQTNEQRDRILDTAEKLFLEQVRAGAGVVLIGTDDGQLFSDAKMLEDTPPLLDGTGAVKVLTFGTGRIPEQLLDDEQANQRKKKHPDDLQPD